jgi:aryl-alcohol dehydrogenase-like predicted oxidoreductase
VHGDGGEPANVALAWLLSNPVVTAPIIGPRTIEQLDDTLRTLEITLDSDTLKKIDDIFPAVGLSGNESKPAPEAYAW